MLDPNRKSWEHGDLVSVKVVRRYQAQVCRECGYPNNVEDDYCDDCGGAVYEATVADIEETMEDGYVSERVSEEHGRS